MASRSLAFLAVFTDVVSWRRLQEDSGRDASSGACYAEHAVRIHQTGTGNALPCQRSEDIHVVLIDW